MVVYCSVCMNNTRKNKNISYYNYPKEYNRRRDWLIAVGREDLLLKLVDDKTRQQYRICEDHFERKCIKFSKNRTVKYLFDYAFPTLKLTSNEGASSNSIQENAFPTVNLPSNTGTNLNQFENVSVQENQNRGCSPSHDEIRVFCPKCNAEVSHTAHGIQEDQTKMVIAKVYHYLKQEFEELKTTYENLDLTPLSRIHQRTALATGVSETTVFQILKEEEERNAAAKQEEVLGSQRKARKRPRRAYSLRENSSDEDIGEAGEQSGIQDERVTETLVVKVEPPEYHEEPEITVKPMTVKLEPTEEVNMDLGDPIAVDVKTEPQDEEPQAENTNETMALNVPGGSKRRGRKKKKNDVTAQQHSQGESSTTEASSSVPYTEELDENCLLGEREVKIEKLEIDEDGFS